MDYWRAVMRAGCYAVIPAGLALAAFTLHAGLARGLYGAASVAVLLAGIVMYAAGGCATRWAHLRKDRNHARTTETP